MARADRPVGALRREPRVGAEHLGEGLKLRFERPDAVKERVDRIDRRETARPDRPAEFGRGGVDGIEFGHRLTAC